MPCAQSADTKDTSRWVVQVSSCFETYPNHNQYWNWDRYAKDPANSPLFDGSEGSMGGNGAKVAHQGIPIPGAPRPYNMIPPADGGGCVTTGPFTKYAAPAKHTTLSVHSVLTRHTPPA